MDKCEIRKTESCSTLEGKPDEGIDGSTDGRDTWKEWMWRDTKEGNMEGQNEQLCI